MPSQPSHVSRPEPSAQRIPSSTPEAATPTHPAGTARQGAPDPRRLAPRDILQLQRTVGNRAVGRLLRGAGARAAVQRQVTYDVPAERPVAGVADYVQALNGAVYQAYQYVLHVPTLGKYRDLDGHTEHWAELWAEYQKDGSSGRMAAAFGYAIETLATLVYLPPAPPGLGIELQGSRAGTRPDVILKKGEEDVAWLDITSLQSEGHIWQKAHWDRATIHLAELAYPKMELAHFVPTDNYDDKVDEGAFRKRIFWANKLLEYRRSAWRALATQFRAPRGGDPISRAARLPGVLRERIRAYFEVEVDDDTAASVLWAMGINPLSWTLNRSVSRSRGESFLLLHDPNLPTIEIPEDGVPRPVPLSPEYRAMLAQAVREEASLSDGPGLGLEPIEEENALVAAQPGGMQEHGGGGQIQPVATFRFQMSGLDRITPELLDGLGTFLQQNQLTMALDLSFGGFRTQILAQPGPNFAASFGAMLANLEIPDFSGLGEYDEDDRESSSPPERQRQLRQRKRHARLQARLALLPFPNARRRIAPPALPSFLALLGADPSEEGLL